MNTLAMIRPALVSKDTHMYLPEVTRETVDSKVLLFYGGVMTIVQEYPCQTSTTP